MYKIYKLNSIKEYKDKIKACQELNLKFELSGTLKEFEYDIFNDHNTNSKNSIVGDFKSYPERIDYLRKYDNFKESDIKFKSIHANDNIYLPNEKPIDFDCIVFKKRFFVFDNIELYVYMEDNY